LLPLVVTWLVHYGHFIARHRLRRLLLEQGDAESSAILGLILEAAIDQGATAELRIVLDACRPAAEPRSPFAIDQISPVLRDIAKTTASPLALKWNLWAPEITLKHDAIRPVTWLLGLNPSLRGRIIRKGDLRASILETLRHDTGGQVPSESQLARLVGATRVAVRHALAALVLEGEITIEKRPGNARDNTITLRRTA
jgi:hypothetical protein